MADRQAGSSAQWATVLADVPLFSGLSNRQLRKVARLAVARRYPRLTAIVREGTPGNTFFVILDGSARVLRPGKRALTLGKGDFFGEIALLDGAPRSATVEAQTEVLTLQLGRTGFAKMLASDPQIATGILRTLAARLRAAQALPSD